MNGGKTERVREGKRRAGRQEEREGGKKERRNISRYVEFDYFLGKQQLYKTCAKQTLKILLILFTNLHNYDKLYRCTQQERM